jgi:hypothetical protein
MVGAVDAVAATFNQIDKIDICFRFADSNRPIQQP